MTQISNSTRSQRETRPEADALFHIWLQASLQRRHDDILTASVPEPLLELLVD